MLNFNYYTPTRVVFGKGTVEQVGALAAQQGAHKVLVHFGGGSAVRSGLIDRVLQSLQAAGLECVQLGGVQPNPRLSKVYEGIELCRAEGVDFILPVGGGSVIDSAKAIAYGLKYQGDVWDFYCKKAQATDCMPLGVILTIAAAGSEMSDSSVITNENGWLKRGYSNDICRPRFAIMDPELTYTLPAYQTASGAVDIMMHTLERYFGGVPTMELTDRTATGLLKTMMKYTPIAIEQPENYEAHAEIMWAGSLSHNGLTGCGSDGGDWSCHQLEHELGGMFDVAHGAGLSAVWSTWARYVVHHNVERFAQFAQEVMDIPPMDSTIATALTGITALQDFFRSIGMPTRLHELGIELTDAQIEELAYTCSFEGTRTIGRFTPLDREQIKHIYELAR